MPFFMHDGLRLHYRQGGEGPPVILLPGNTASSAHLQNEINRLSSSYQASGLDLRGTGKSERLPRFDREWAVQSAGDVAALIDYLGHRQAVLIGTSGGAMIALLSAIHHPDRVQAVIADSFVPHWSAEFLQTVAAGRRTVDEGAKQFWAYGHGDDWQAVVENDTRWLQTLAAEGGLDITPDLVRIGCPVLLTGTLADSLLPDVGSQLTAAAQALVNGELYLCHAGDHPLIWSVPDRFWAVSDPFLERVVAASTATPE